MKKSCLTLLVLTFLLAALGSVPAQNSEQDSIRACVIVSEGQNRNRKITGAVNVECGASYPSPRP